MLKIHNLVLGMYQVNCYIVHNENSDRCVIIDPGYMPEKILLFLQGNGVTIHLEMGGWTCWENGSPYCAGA